MQRPRTTVSHTSGLQTRRYRSVHLALVVSGVRNHEATRFFKSRPDFRPKNVIFYTLFQTRPLKSTPVFRPGLQAEIMLSLLTFEHKQNNYSIHFKFAHFSSFLLHFGVEMINMFIHYVVPSKTIPDSRPKWAKFIPIFRR